MLRFILVGLVACAMAGCKPIGRPPYVAPCHKHGTFVFSRYPLFGRHAIAKSECPVCRR